MISTFLYSKNNIHGHHIYLFLMGLLEIIMADILHTSCLCHHPSVFEVKF